jgi:drug/metabolite transporter (DMT)-like permease
MSALATRQTGLLLLLVTAVGWGSNWPMVKLLLQEWPPLFARGVGSVAAALLLAAVAVVRRDPLAVERRTVPALLFAAAINVFAWMGFATLSLKWLAVAEAALLVYTMPIWAALLAWPIQGVRPTPTSLLALLLGASGVVVLFGGQGVALGPNKILGVVCALSAAILFAYGTVASRKPLPLPPLVSVAWQVGLGGLPMVLLGLAFEHPQLGALTATGWTALGYMIVMPMGLCYLTWFAALRRVPAPTAAMATLLTPVIGVLSSAWALGEPFGARQIVALLLTLTGVTLALRKA